MSGGAEHRRWKLQTPPPQIHHPPPETPPSPSHPLQPPVTGAAEHRVPGTGPRGGRGRGAAPMNHVWPQDDAQEGVPERGCNVEMGFWRWRGPAALLGKTPPRDPCMDLELRGGPQGLSGDCHHHGEDGGTGGRRHFPSAGSRPRWGPPPSLTQELLGGPLAWGVAPG